MKIPKKVKIGGTVYKVKEVDRINRFDNSDDHYIGLWVEEEATIYLDKNVEIQIEEKCFLHELLHGIFDHCNIEQDEGEVRLLENALYMVIKDNPGIFSN